MVSGENEFYCSVGRITDEGDIDPRDINATKIGLIKVTKQPQLDDENELLYRLKLIAGRSVEENEFQARLEGKDATGKTLKAYLAEMWPCIESVAFAGAEPTGEQLVLSERIKNACGMTVMSEEALEALFPGQFRKETNCTEGRWAHIIMHRVRGAEGEKRVDRFNQRRNVCFQSWP